MAIEVGRTIKELEKMSQKLSITVTPSKANGGFKKEDYILPIRDYYLNQRYGSLNNIPNHMQMMLHMKSPMLAKRIDDVKEEIAKEVWESDQWYFEEKLNGARMRIVKDNSGIHIYSRHNSDEDLLPIEYTDSIIFPKNFNIDKIPETFILDSEMTSDSDRLNTVIGKVGVETETMLQAVTALLSADVSRAREIQERENLILTFNAFDCIYYNGQWITEEPLKKRRALAMELITKLYNAGFKIRPVRSNRSNKREFYKSIILTGGEGCVAKSINGIYLPDSNRRDDGWLKIKRSVSEMKSLDDAIGDTIDGWVSGFTEGTKGSEFEGMIATIQISVYLHKLDGTTVEHEIANISGFDMKLRQDMTEIVDGVVTLKPSYYGRIVEIDGAGVSARKRAFNHAVLVGFRYDKNKGSCIMEESFLNKLIL